ncbi:hypothetical protein BDN67DRAFT_702440, partial [Paxillus ammoniavirescens]
MSWGVQCRQPTTHSPLRDRNLISGTQLASEEPELGVNGYLVAIKRSSEFIQKLKGDLDLLLFMRGNRVYATTQSNYRLFYEVLPCGSKVAIVHHTPRTETRHGG